MNNIKVAVCLSGALRSFKEIYQSLYKNIIEPYDADIFMHCWVKGNMSKKERVKNNKVISSYKWIKDKTTEKDVLNLCTPKKYVFEVYNSDICDNLIDKYELNDIIYNKLKSNENDSKEMKDYKYKSKRYLINTMGMYHKIFMVNELKREYENENNFKYDIVIRCRPDFMYESLLKFESLKIILDNENKNNMILKVLDKYAFNSLSNDKFSLGSSIAIDKYCLLIKNIKKITEELIDKNILTEGQIYDKIHINNLKLKRQWIDFLYERNDRPGKTKLKDSQRRRLKVCNISKKF